MSYASIPAELRSLKQWVNWRYEQKEVGKKPTKVLYQTNGYRASSIDPATWDSFEAVTSASNQIGFVFSPDDPYCGIDLDESTEHALRQKEIYDACQSYTELSPSGKGVHIIVRAFKAGTGWKKLDTECYSQGRFFTFTGNVIRALPIVDCQAQVDYYFPYVAPIVHAGLPVSADDAEIVRRVLAARNGDKAARLAAGDITGYPSASEAEMALGEMIFFHSKNEEQSAAIFATTALGQRTKSSPKRTAKMFSKLAAQRFDLPTIDFSVLYAPPLPAPSIYDPPPGLLGDVQRFIFSQMLYPVQEIAFAAALGLLAGICGRQYNVGGSGLNLYIVLIAETGSGKESGIRGVNKIMRRVAEGLRGTIDPLKFIGSGKYASGQALVKDMAEAPHSFLAPLSEFGSKLSIMCSPKASTAEMFLKEAILDLFHKSGQSDILRSTSYSDREMKTPNTASPAFSFFGDTAPDLFYSNFTSSTVAQGLYPRFLIVDYRDWYEGDGNENAHKIQPCAELVQSVQTLCGYVLNLFRDNTFVEIEPTEEALPVWREFERRARKAMHPSNEQLVRDIWTRANIKMRRLAALVSLGINYHSPVITLQAVEWAIAIVERDISSLLSRITKGETGATHSETHREQLIKKAIKDWLTQSWDKVAIAAQCPQSLHKEKIIPVSFISKKVVSYSAFREPNRSPSKVLHETLQAMQDNGLLVISASHGDFTGKVVRITNIMI